jgi:formate hydrogenlyase subunit 6/NADH:ubiquinone oxidoreductase subunit I
VQVNLRILILTWPSTSCIYCGLCHRGCGHWAVEVELALEPQTKEHPAELQIDKHPAELQTDEQSAEFKTGKTIPQIETNMYPHAEVSIPGYIITTVKHIKESLQELNVR